MNGAILYAMLIGLIFVTWPIIGRYSGLSGAWIGLLACFFTFLSVAGFSYREITALPGWKAVGMLALAGLLNGLGVYLYSLKTADPQIVTSTFVVTTSMMMVVWAPILDYMFNGLTFQSRQIAGFGAAALAIYLLGK